MRILRVELLTGEENKVLYPIYGKLSLSKEEVVYT